MIKRFDDKVAAQSPSKPFWKRYAEGERLGWVFGPVTIGGRSEKRMFVCYHDKDGNPLDVPTRFPALEIVLPAAPISPLQRPPPRPPVEMPAAGSPRTRRLRTFRRAS